MRTNQYLKKRHPYREISQGDIIIAQPFHSNHYLQRSVILIIEKSRQVGDTGVILNKLSTIHMNEALFDTSLTNPVYFSGPHDLNLISFIHNNKDLRNTVPIASGLYWGGDFASLESKIENGAMEKNDVRFLAGFMEWNAGELEREIAAGKWWVSDINAGELLTIHPDQLWSKKLLGEGNLYGIMDAIEDPCMN
jgi:putative transcriptional regulator